MYCKPTVWKNIGLEKRLTPAGKLFRIKKIKQEGGLYVGIKCNGVSCNLILQGRMM